MKEYIETYTPWKLHFTYRYAVKTKLDNIYVAIYM